MQVCGRFSYTLDILLLAHYPAARHEYQFSVQGLRR